MSGKTKPEAELTEPQIRAKQLTMGQNQPAPEPEPVEDKPEQED